MKMTAQEYARRVRRVGPHSPLGLDCLWAFGVGGGICLLGEVLRQSYLAARWRRWCTARCCGCWAWRVCLCCHKHGQVCHKIAA